MIKSVEFENFRNLKGKYEFNNVINVILGKNNSGKTNVLDGIKLAFSTISNDYFRINKSDFKDSDDSNVIMIKIELEVNSIPTLNFIDENGIKKCGFRLIVKKTQSERYVKEISLLNGSNVDYDSLRDDPKIPNLYTIPLLRVEDIYTDDLSTGIKNFIDSESKYRELKNESKEAIKKEMKTKIEKFKSFCGKFNQNLDVAISEPRISNEKVYIIDGDNENKEHNYKIGAGYKSIANIILNTLSDNYNIILIDEIENHLHPSLIRTLIRELRNVQNTILIATTHSPVVINELKMEELIDISCKKITSLKPEIINKLNIFLHPGRSELLMSDNIVLVEGYTEELLLNNYLYKYNRNWTIVNVSGVMFEPYIALGTLLDKRMIVISDNDICLSDKKQKSARFTKLEEICKSNNIKLIEIDNTLETDLYNNGFLSGCTDLLVQHPDYNDIYIAKKNKKTEIAQLIIQQNINLSKWHVIEDLENEFGDN